MGKGGWGVWGCRPAARSSGVSPDDLGDPAPQHVPQTWDRVRTGLAGRVTLGVVGVATSLLETRSPRGSHCGWE